VSYRLVVVASVSSGLALVVEVVQPAAATAIVVTKMHTISILPNGFIFPSIARNRYVAQEISLSCLMSFALSKSLATTPNFLFYDCLLTDFNNGPLKCSIQKIICNLANYLR
jgi:hypothetical protein